ncbi:MAG: hypothetical protein AABO58_10945 [Acidobacteriota bacterium]
MATDLVLALAFGLAGMCFVYLTVVRESTERHLRLVAAVAAAALGVITTGYLLKHPALLERAAGDVALGVLAGILGMMVAVAGRKRDPS